MSTTLNPKKKSGFIGERYIVIPSEMVQTAATDPIISDLYITAIGYFPEAQYHHTSREAGNNDNVLIFCKEGKGWVEIDNGPKYIIQPNDFVIIPQGASYSYGADNKEPWSIYWAFFSGTKAHLLCQDQQVPKKVKTDVEPHAFYRTELFEEIYFMIGNGRSLNRMAYASHCFHHLMATFTYVDLYAESTSRRKPADNFVHIAISYMSEHIDKTLSITELAAKCGYSRSHFTHSFTHEMGMAPKEYFMRMKVNRACLLLKNTNESIVEIAMRMGFGEGQYFSRTFKKLKGITATQYRQISRRSESEE